MKHLEKYVIGMKSDNPPPPNVYEIISQEFFFCCNKLFLSIFHLLNFPLAQIPTCSNSHLLNFPLAQLPTLLNFQLAQLPILLNFPPCSTSILLNFPLAQLPTLLNFHLLNIPEPFVNRYKNEAESSKNSAGVLVQSVNHATGKNTWKVRTCQNIRYLESSF